MSVYGCSFYTATGKGSAEKNGGQRASLKPETGCSSVLGASDALRNSSCSPDALEGCYWVERKIKKLGCSKRLKTLIYFNKNGDAYEGNFIGTGRNGEGTLVLAGGGEYKGPFVNGKPHGRGEFVFPNQKKYEGTFNHGEMTGEGTVYFPNGNIYKGPVRNGRPHGKGVLLFVNGGRYEGSFHCGEMADEGTIYFSNGNIYKGPVCKGKPHGQGVLFLSTGGQYEGDFFLGEMTGNARIYFANGDQYEGPVQSGKPHGRGVLFGARGDISKYIGDFCLGEMEGEGTIYFRDGDRYQGHVCKAIPQGQGVFFSSNGLQYKGAFENGQANGVGVIAYSDGSRYEGECFEMQQHGIGTYFNKYQVPIEGMWRQGALVGLNKDDLGHPAFLSSLLDGADFPSKTGVFSIFYDYFRCKPGYSDIAEALLSVLNRESSDQVYDHLINLKPLLISPNIDEHAILVSISVKDESVIFQAFNSGDGLVQHDQDPQRKGYYRTMLQIQVPKASVSKETIERLLGRFVSTGEFYSFLLGLEGSEKCSAIHAPWQKQQKGDDCSIESVFAFLKNVLGKKAYHCMRMEFFDDCAKSAKKFKNANPAYIQKLQQKKAKRAARYPQFHLPDSASRGCKKNESKE